MLVVSGTITVSEETLDAALAAIATLVAETVKEDGCGTYGFYQTPGQPNVFRVVEEWESLDHMNAHMASEHFLTFMGLAGEIGITGAELHQYEIAEKSRLM